MSRYPIVDTNVVVSGLLASQPLSSVARILDGMLRARFSFVLSEALLAEYRAVLLRPRVTALHGLSEAEVDALLMEAAQHAIVLQPRPTRPAKAPDPGDQFLWDLLGTRADLVLVTEDKRLLDAPDMAHWVMTPAAFADTLGTA